MLSSRIVFAVAAVLALGGCSHQAAVTAPIAPIQLRSDAPAILAAIADTRRPEADRARDVHRHPAETLAFARIVPGARVADLLPGGGYFTRLIAVDVGPEGRVYPTIRPEGLANAYETPILAVAAEYSNAVVSRTAYDALAYPEALDVVFTAQNYHDMYLTEYGLGSAAEMNRTAFAALRPGGHYVIIDHAALAGAPLETDAQTALHRIDQARVRREVEAAGFVFDGESEALRNPDDARTINVFDPAIRGRTDQFMMRFRKPG